MYLYLRSVSWSSIRLSNQSIKINVIHTLELLSLRKPSTFLLLEKITSFHKNNHRNFSKELFTKTVIKEIFE